MPEDRAITSSKSDVDPCSHGREPDRRKSADGRTDGFSALYSRRMELITCNTTISGVKCKVI